MKQTAVEWLVNCIESMDWGKITTRKELYNKAKKMEKEQIRKAYFVDVYNTKYGFQQYYNDNFKTK